MCKYFNNNSNPTIGGKPHDQTIYNINLDNSLNTFPSKGNPKILVIPVSFTDYKQNSTKANLEKIEKT